MRAGIRSRPWAGLDVGSFSVKLVATQGGSASRLWTAEAQIPATSDDGGAPSPEVIAQTVTDCLTAAGLSARGLRGVTMGISGPDVFLKQIALPLIDEAEVGPALRFEARKHLPFDPQQMVIDYQVIGRYPSERKLEVLLAAVTREHLERHLAPLALLGLEVDILDATPLALLNAMAAGTEADDPLVLLDIGHSASHLTLHQRGEPYFSRRLDFGGTNLTRAIAEGTSVPLEEAEEWKLAAGSDESGLKVDWSLPETQAMLDCLQRQLAEEVRRSLTFYRTLGRLPDPLRIGVSGGSARLPGIANRLTEMLGVPVSVFDPLDSVADPRPKGAMPRPQFAQAFGLAQRSA